MKNALIIIDAQMDMFAEATPVYDAGGLLERLERLISQARRNGVPMFFIQNNGSPGDPDEPGTPGWEIHPRLAPKPGDVVLSKNTADAFFDTALRSILDEGGVHKLILAGLQTEYCVYATALRANDLGYAVTLVKDGHSTYDDALTAAEIIEQYNRQLGEIVQVTPAEAIHFSG